MVTVKLWLLAIEEHVRLEEPVPFAVNETLVAVKALHVRPATVLLVSATVPTKLNVLVRVMVDVAELPEGTLGGEVALMVKSPT